jgi:hypothetical protein
MGLTGHILEVTFRMERISSPWLWQEAERVPNIDVFVERLKAASTSWPLTGGWIDCLTRGAQMGRGLLFKSRWATPSEAPAAPPRPKKRLTVPFEMPSFVMGRPSIRAFNALVYRQPLAHGIVHPETVFYPLDWVRRWNAMYGRSGLTQHQCVLPNEAGLGAVRRFLEVLVARGGASFLCVIKDCGPEASACCRSRSQGSRSRSTSPCAGTRRR